MTVITPATATDTIPTSTTFHTNPAHGKPNVITKFRKGGHVTTFCRRKVQQPTQYTLVVIKADALFQALASHSPA